MVAAQLPLPPKKMMSTRWLPSRRLLAVTLLPSVVIGGAARRGVPGVAQCCGDSVVAFDSRHNVWLISTLG
jgi:hypothetical protein